MDLAAWLQELRRRRVIRALLGWGLVSFAVLQVAEPVMHGFHLPDWALKIIIWCLVAGFPITVVLAYNFVWPRLAGAAGWGRRVVDLRL